MKNVLNIVILTTIVIGFSWVVSESKESSEEAFEPGKDGWVSLFDGVQLRGWKTAAKSDWAVKDGLLTGTKGEILNRWCWKDFELATRFRGAGTVRFRAGSDQIGNIGYTGYDQPGYRLDLNQGTLGIQDGNKIADIDLVVKKDAWNQLRISAVAGSFTISLNGKTIAETEDNSFLKMGRIGFIANGKSFEIERLRARPLGVKKIKNIPGDNYYCYVCHINFEEEPLAVGHDENDVRCVECHGPSMLHREDEDNVTPPDILYRRSEVDANCMNCHDRHDDKSEEIDKPLPKVKVCTDCHGEHRFLH